ncbi:hypothetical protein N9W21_06650 [Shewanella sp.]|nr:hypothetical protein [Shewanella sp.]
MLWFIAAITTGVVFLLAPEKAIENNKLTSYMLSKLNQYSLLLLPALILIWLVLAIFNTPSVPFAGTALGFVLTSCAVALTQLHKYLAGMAGVTCCALLTEVILSL